MKPSNESYDYSDPHASRPYFDMQAAIILLLAIAVVMIISRVNVRADATITTAPISTPALPTPAPIYYQPVPTLIPIPAAPPQSIDNSDHRICVFVVDCSQ